MLSNGASASTEGWQKLDKLAEWQHNLKAFDHNLAKKKSAQP